MKTVPTIGDPCYLRQFTGSYYVDLVKTPYTVVEVSARKIKVQECKLIYPVFHYDPDTMTEYYKQFDNKRVCFFDTIAEEIVPDPTGVIEELTWHPKSELWGTNGAYPLFAIFGAGYQHQPYLD